MLKIYETQLILKIYETRLILKIYGNCLILKIYNDFHLKCEQINNKDIPLPPDWICLGCTMKALPFGNISDENMKLINQGLSD